MSIKSYILSIVIASAVCAITTGLVNTNTFTGKICSMLGGVLLVVTVISPLIHIRFQSVKEYWSGISQESKQYVSEGESAAQQEVAAIIKTQTETYILDKANSMGLEIAVEVELDARNYSIPCGVQITGDASPYAKSILCAYIEENLGIPKENQLWT